MSPPLSVITKRILTHQLFWYLWLSSNASFRYTMVSMIRRTLYLTPDDVRVLETFGQPLWICLVRRLQEINPEKMEK